jgi:hypothetical protein
MGTIIYEYLQFSLQEHINLNNSNEYLENDQFNLPYNFT